MSSQEFLQGRCCSQASSRAREGKDNAKNAEDESNDSPIDVIFTVTIPSATEVVDANGIGNGEDGASDLGDNLGTENALDVQNSVMKSARFNLEGGELEDFLDPLDIMSAWSNTEGEGNSEVGWFVYLVPPTTEFFDAWEGLSSESGPHHPPHDVEAEMHELRLSLLMEMEKRKQSDEVLYNIRSQWLRIQHQFSLVGLTLLTDPITTVNDEQLLVDPIEVLSSSSSCSVCIEFHWEGYCKG